MEEFCLYISDLTEDAQERLIKFLGGDDGNYGTFPVLTLYKEEPESGNLPSPQRQAV